MSVLAFKERLWTAGGSGLELDASSDGYRRWESLPGSLRDQHRTGWVRVVAAADSPVLGELIVKTHVYPTASDRRRGLFRNTVFARSRARCEAENLLELHRRQLNPPLLVAFGERRRGAVLHACFIATRFWPSTDLAHWLPEERDSTVRRQTLEQLGCLVARLHAAGYVDRDLHLRNILRSPDGVLAKIDCSRGRFGPRPFDRACLRDWSDLGGELERCLEDREKRVVVRAYLNHARANRAARSVARRAAARCRERRSPARS